VRVASGAELLWGLPDTGGAVQAALADIKANLKPGETLVAMPEGVMLNYLSRHSNPTPHISFMPPERIMFGEDAMLSALAAHPPDYVAWVPKGLQGYGYQALGVDYAPRLWNWLTENYTLTRPMPQDGKFTVMLMRRNTLPAP